MIVAAISGVRLLPFFVGRIPPTDLGASFLFDRQPAFEITTLQGVAVSSVERRGDSIATITASSTEDVTEAGITYTIHKFAASAIANGTYYIWADVGGIEHTSPEFTVGSCKTEKLLYSTRS